MVAEHWSEPAALALLYEPDKPDSCWRGKSRRNRQDRTVEALDFGAKVQHAIALYVLTGASRSDVARSLGLSERHTQDVLLGRAWGLYGRPVIRALAALGIRLGRGRWYGARARRDEIIAASQIVMRRAIEAIERPEIPLYDRDRLLADLRLLTVAADDQP